MRQLAVELSVQLKGYTLVSCFSQSKDELLTEFNNGAHSFFIKASLQPAFCCLSFPRSFARARKNSVDLFNSLLMQRVSGVGVYDNERSFAIHLETGGSLLFKMHGNRANVLALQHQRVVDIFRNQLAADRQLEIDNLAREINWSKEYFLAHRSHIFEKYFTLGREVQQYLLARQYDTQTPEQQWSEMQAVLELLHQPKYYLIEQDGKLVLSLLPFGEIRKQYTTAIEALNDFFLAYTQQDAFVREKARGLQMADDQIKHATAYLATSTSRLRELESDTHWQQWADLLMANLHQVTPGADRVRVSNFYNNGAPIEIPLKKELSAQKNAEVYYRKSKNRVIEVQHLREAIATKQQTLESVRAVRVRLAEADQLKDVRELSATLGRAQKKRGPSSKPFHEFVFQGYQIRVGKDAASNDELTLRHSHKEDLWLHAKDVAGSHVVVKHQAGKKFPKEVIERAAQLAAYNSKRKTETLCPVTVTPRKFVRKRKGDPPGAVIVEREEVILVEPRL